MTVTIQHHSFVVFTFLSILFATLHAPAAADPRFERVPNDGVQPQVLVDTENRQHLLYFKGDAMGGDIFYVTSNADAKEFSAPMRINSRDGSVIAAGTMRGPQMTLGKNGRVHVVWMGGNGASKVKVGDENTTPLLYSRMTDDRKSFEKERNILTHIAGLDGGQTVAADQKGNVFVIWHGAPPGTENEEDRGLYVARSSDDGRSFAREKKGMVPKRGACACCGLRAKVDQEGKLHVLFRSAEGGTNRDELWLRSDDGGETFDILKEDPWKIATCPASSASFAFTREYAIGAWESDNRTIVALSKGGKFVQFRPEGSQKQKHPTIAVNEKGQVLLTWVEDAGWGKEGTLICQQFDSNGKPVGGQIRRTGLPAWSFGAPVATKEGFVVYY